jgi:hypothetical protein
MNNLVLSYDAVDHIRLLPVYSARGKLDTEAPITVSQVRCPNPPVALGTFLRISPLLFLLQTIWVEENILCSYCCVLLSPKHIGHGYGPSSEELEVSRPTPREQFTGKRLVMD